MKNWFGSRKHLVSKNSVWWWVATAFHLSMLGCGVDESVDGPMQYKYQPNHSFQLSLSRAVAKKTTYSGNVEPILQNSSYKCQVCHTNTAAAHVDLSSFPFASVKYGNNQKAIVNSIIDRITKPSGNGQRMPIGNLPALSSSEVGTIQQWLDQGLAP